MHLVLTLLFCACVGAPVLALLRRPAHAGLAFTLAAAALWFLLARSPVDLLAFGTLQVDGALQGGACGPGLRPSR